MKFLFDDGDQHVGLYGVPDLRLHRVLVGGQKSLDPQMLFDLLEEQVDPPAALIQSGDAQGRQCHAIGQKYQRVARLHIFEFNPSKRLRVIPADVKTIQCDALISDHTCSPIGCGRVQTAGVHGAFGAGEEKRTAEVKFEQPTKIQIAAIHDVERARLDRQDT